MQFNYLPVGEVPMFSVLLYKRSYIDFGKIQAWTNYEREFLALFAY